MRRFFFSVFTLGILLNACSKNADFTADDTNIEAFGEAHRGHCASMEVLSDEIKTDPSRGERLAVIDELAKKFASDPVAQAKLLSTGVMEIPVVWNVIYKTASENISDAQLATQLTVLNNDFAATNADYNNTPSLFQGVRSGDCQIKFVLSNTVRKLSSKTSWSTNNDMKKSTKGGINATTPTTKLNIWVVNKMTSSGQTILGYAQFPGGVTSTDGVVLGHKFVGTNGTASAPFNKGRTATHEVGHWLNLRHIWGDAACGNDQVGDTPLASGPNYGCPSFPAIATSCAGQPTMQTMNYMDYTDDACMYMFSVGQKSRMQATYAVGGPRASFRP